MKYIISESKLENTVILYLNTIFDVDNMNSHHPFTYEDETGEEGDDETAIVFYHGDWADEKPCFKWYSCEYFNEGSPARDICPEVAVEHPYSYELDSYFGDLWTEPFKKWFTKSFNLPVKTVDGM